MVDSLQIFEILKAGSISESEARAMTLAIKQAEAGTVSELKAFIEQGFAASDLKMAAQFAAFEAKIDRKFGALEGRFASIDQRFEIMRTEASETKVELLRWMFAFWIGQSATTIGLIFAGVKLLK